MSDYLIIPIAILAFLSPVFLIGGIIWYRIRKSRKMSHVEKEAHFEKKKESANNALSIAGIMIIFSVLGSSIGGLNLGTGSIYIKIGGFLIGCLLVYLSVKDKISSK